MSFNTASGRHIHSIRFVFPSFQSGTRDVRTSSSLCSSVASPPSSHTASGKYCCNKLAQGLVDAAIDGFNTASGKYCCNELIKLLNGIAIISFNTASGKYCCNLIKDEAFKRFMDVSIPQAVSTVATAR